jgi:hypothetical protein
MIQGEFKEREFLAREVDGGVLITVPSGTLRSFTRTFILADAGQGTP